MVSGSKHSPSGGHIMLIAIFAILVGFSGLLTVPPLDRDESRFIQATTQMIETGDYIRIKYQEEERNKKPVGIYWLQAASVQLIADVEDRPLWAYRIPSLLGAMLACIFTYFAGTALFGRNAGFLGAMLLAAAPVVAGEASIAKTDAALLASVCGMQAALARLITARPGDSRRGLAVAFWVAMGAGVLIKGPITPMIGIFTLGGLVFWSWRTGQNVKWSALLKPIMGVGILVAMVLPWAIWIGLLTEGRFFSEAIGTDMLGKVTTGQESHGGPFGYHLVGLWLMFWPAALFIPAALRHALPRAKECAFAMCLAWLIPSWLVFELTSTKLAHYTMVLFPAIALMVGQLLISVPADNYRVFRWIGAGLYSLVGIIAAVLIVFLAATYSIEGLNGWHIFAGVLITAGTCTAVFFTFRKNNVMAMAVAVLVSGTFAWIAFEGVLPTLDRLALTPRLATMLDRNEAHPLRDDTDPVALVGYHEPSAVFMLGTATHLFTAEEAAVWLIASTGRAVVIESREIDNFKAALPKNTAIEAIETIEGFNYSNNKDMRLTLYRLR